MHSKAKAVIKEVYLKNKAGDPNFRSLTGSMKAHLRQSVGENYWKKADHYLNQFLQQRREERERFDLLVEKGLMR